MNAVSRRRPQRTQAHNNDHAFDTYTTTSETDEAWHSLDLETQAYQAMLEAVRLDPEDEQLAQDLIKAKALMELAWLQRQPILVRAPNSRTGFATILFIYQIATLRAFVLRHRLHMQRGHRRKPRP